MNLDDDEDLLALAKSGMTPSVDERAKMRSRLMTTVGVAGAAGAVASSAAASTGLGVKVIALVLGGAVVAAGGYALTTREPAPSADVSAPATPREATAVERSEPEPRAETETPTETPTLEAAIAEPEPEPEPVAQIAAPRVVTARTRPPTEEPETELAPAERTREEAALIGRARAALNRGDTAASLRALAEHSARFPDGFLAEERDVSRVAALCAAGQTERAQAMAARFRREHPSSLSAAAMADPCP